VSKQLAFFSLFFLKGDYYWTFFGMDYNVSFSALCESFGGVKNQFKLVEQFGTNGLSVVLAEEKRKQQRCGQGRARVCWCILYLNLFSAFLFSPEMLHIYISRVTGEYK